MDKGAHFYKCDFQVHTPRDSQWKGKEAVTPQERRAYAEELVQACRVRSIDAIAITDHHDLAFFPYVRKAAQEELDGAGKPIPGDKQLIVFPGLELTLTSPTCQALLILDANFPENLLPSVLTALSITPSAADESKEAQVQRIPQNVVKDLGDLYERLSSHQELRGRFIVLPNVSETGHGTLLRSGFANFYKSMPCVGGYVDGSVTQFGTGNLSIVRGENRDYGFKAIAVFQTSDNRSRNHEDLGKHATWVKWSEPTAEALRQACLAKESRMSQAVPVLPSHWITSVSVSNSKFLARVELEFNQQCNAIIGGRGTGKSTILEYLRWGLCDDAIEELDSDIAPVQVRRKKLIEDTLKKFDGEVHVSFEINGVRHIVKRNSSTLEVLLKIGEGTFVKTSEQEVRNLLPTQAYSQKQLSSVGVRIEELKRFVELPVKKDLDLIRSEIRDAGVKMRSAYGQLVRKRELDIELAKYAIESDSLDKQLEGLRAGLKGLSPADQAIIDQKPKYDTEEGVIESLHAELTRAERLVTSLSTDLGDLQISSEEAIDLQNPDLVKQIQDEFAAKFNQIRERLATLITAFSKDEMKPITERVQEWAALKSEFDKKYAAAKAASTVNQQQLDQIQETEGRRAALKKLQTEKRSTLSALGDPEAAYKDLRSQWSASHASKVTLLDKQCQQFTSLSNGLIKAEIMKTPDVNLLKQQLKNTFAGMNIREQKIEDICQNVVKAAKPLDVWAQVLGELEQLALHKLSEPQPLPVSQLLSTCGFTENERRRIATGLTTERWLDLSTLEVEFSPVFSYCTNQTTNEYIAFVDASAGQQATALLTVLLNQQGPPLIIDQPEDDVDSKLVKEIIEQIWKAKGNRQLVIASHNANFVVNGDAELVVCCDYVKAGDQTGGQIKCTGAIDIAIIKDEITIVTEGGKEAFKLRMDKYGF